MRSRGESHESGAVIERARRLSLEEGAHALLLFLAVAALARSRPEPLAWLAVLPVVAAIAFRIVRAPALLGSTLERATWLALGVVMAVVLNWLVSPAGQGEPAPPLPAAAGYGMALLAALLLSGRALWPPARAAMPAALGILVIALSQNSASMRVTVGLCALSAVALLAAPSGARPGAAARVARLAAFGLVAAAVALSIAWLLPWAQPKVLQAAANFAFPDAETGFSLETRLGDVGELRVSPRVVLRVWTDRPQNLRGAVATAFDGRSWHSPYPGTSAPVPPAEPDALPTRLEDVEGVTFLLSRPEPGVPLVAMRILQVAPLTGTLLAPAGVVLVRGPQGRLVVDGNRILNPPAPAGRVYGVLNVPGPQAGSEPSAEMLEVPPDTDPRIRDLAARLAAGTSSPELRVARTVEFLRSEYPYSLRMGAFRSRQPVAEFLFEKRQGWCQYFASAGALLLRLEGVPTRFVSGFRLRSGLLRGGHYVVREADAHAWIEVWLPGTGWAEADPTPSAGYEAAHGGLDEGWLAQAWERVRGLVSRVWAAAWSAVPALLWQELQDLLHEPAVRTGAFLASGGLLLLLAMRAWRRHQRRPATLARATDAPPDLARLLARLDRSWARRGVPRPPSRGPLEHVQQIEDARLPPALRVAGRHAVDAYYRARFGGVALPGQAIAELEAELARAEAAPSS
jgi:transglutaminase-like putative cysteine protease